ncbi:ATP-binding cassette domain-containing protein [Clostridium phoceensis]|uniref:ATP-binding cassette domain-containing protein n=1 Tax=Clostridium phoceensis TaxID=1650661 RepID=UPI000AD61739|nr:dipeptide/oligopeptide/nickel ABC transporter ATP-binding protein [Clostridium phoceensis]
MDGLIAKHISKTYAGAHGLSFAALRDVSIHLEPGSFTSLVGESGSGKSTLARLLVGLEPPDQGTISLDGEDTSGWSTGDWRKRRTKLQAVFQDASGTLNPMRSVRSNVEEAMVNLTSLSKRQRRERIGELMELTHMEERLLEVPARQLSGGEQRRLSLVRAMSIRPKYLVLDEVLSGLDLISADAVMRVLEQYHQEFDCAFLLITHDMDSAYRLSDTILTMQAGQIVRVGIKQ